MSKQAGNQSSHHLDRSAWQWIGFVLIAVAVWIVYAPSLMHVARGDQINYLAEVGHQTSFWDLTFGSIDLNRHRQFNPGDELLFRPVDYLLLGGEKYFFGNHFMAWQAVGICLHLAVIWVLLDFLLLIYQGFAAVIVTLFFALLFVNLEMVTWHHINSYMIFVALTLVALRRFYKVLSGDLLLERDCLIMFVVLLVASLTHEMGNVVALLLGITTWITMPKQRLFYRTMLLVPAVYVLASLLNAITHPFTTTMFHQHSTISVLANAAYALGAWFYSGLFSHDQQWLFAARNMIAPEEKHLIQWPHITQPITVVTLLLVVLIACAFFKKQRVEFKNIMLIFVALSLAAAFAMIIVIGRGSQWQMLEVIRINTYYMYIFWIFIILAIYAAVPWMLLRKWHQACIYMLMSLVIVVNAHRLFTVNEQRVRDNNDTIVLINILELLIKERKAEPGFSFYVDPRYPGNYVYPVLRRVDDPKPRAYSLMEVLYPQYFNASNPKYKFLTR